jgi:DNA polymerase II small subunit/DNA polymerase delta subunit B
MKEEIIREFLSKGKLLTPEALEMINNGVAIGDHDGMLVTSQDIRDEERPYSIVKNLATYKREITTDDFVRFYRSKYEKIKNILLGRVQKNFISLNKLDNYRNEVHVIGIIKDIRQKESKTVLEIEDTTATTPIIFEKDSVNGVELDDVVAIRAVSARNILFGKQIIFPDVPLRQPTIGRGKICMISNLNLHEAPRSDVEKFFSWLGTEDIRSVFVAGNIGDTAAFENYVDRYCANKTIFVVPGERDSKELYPQTAIKFSRDNIISLSNPAIVRVGDINVLLIHDFNTIMLKKRYLGKAKRITEDDYLVLEDIPDIVCYGHSNEPQITNYKAVTIACSGSLMATFRPIVIDLATREASQVNLE